MRAYSDRLTVRCFHVPRVGGYRRFRTRRNRHPGFSMTGIGVTLDTHTDLMPGNELRDKVRRIEELGFESVWVTDAMGREPTQLASVEPAAFAPIYVAAHGQKLQRLAAGQADGIMTWAMPAQHTELARKVVGPRAVITAQMPCLVSSDAKEARSVGRNYLSLWLGLPWYCKAWVDAGFSEKDVSDGGSDRLLDAVVPWGDAAVIADRIRGFHRAGADRVIIEPLRTGKPVGPTNAIVGKKSVMADWDSLASIAGAVFHANAH